MAINNSRIAKNTLFLYFRMFLVMGISILTAGVTLRVLGKVDYGLYAVLGGIVAMFSFLNGSLSSAVSRNITFELGKGDVQRTREIFNVSLLIFAFLALIIILLSETIGLWFFYQKMIIPAERMPVAFWVFQLSIINIPFVVTQIPYNAVLVAHENMKIYAYVSIADAIVKLLIVYALVVSPFDKLITLAFLHFVWGIISVGFYRVYCIKKYRETCLMFCRDWKIYKSILTYAGSDIIGNLSCVVQGQGLNLLLNTFFGPVVNAARGIAYGLQGMTTRFSGGFMTAVVPQIIKSYANGDYSGMWRLVERSACFSVYLIWMLALPAWLEGDYVLKLWLGDYPEHTLTFFHLIVIICLIDISRRAIITIIHATGHVFWENVIVGSVLCLSFPFAYICLRMGYAPESVFWCTIGAMIIGGILEMFVLRHYHRYNIFSYVISVYGRCFLVIALSSVIPWAMYSRFMEPCFLRMILTGVITTISVAVAVLYVGMSSADRTRIYEILRNKLKSIVRFWREI